MSISQYERSMRDPSLEQLIKLSDALGVTLDQVAGRVEPPSGDLVEQRLQRQERMLRSILRLLKRHTLAGVASHLGPATPQDDLAARRARRAQAGEFSPEELAEAREAIRTAASLHPGEEVTQEAADEALDLAATYFLRKRRERVGEHAGDTQHQKSQR